MDFSSINLHNEEKFVSYLMKNNQEIDILDFSFLLSENIQMICISLKKLIDEKLVFTIDELYHFVQKVTSEVSKDYLQQIYDKYTNFENIDAIIKIIKENHARNKLTIGLLENVYNALSDTDELRDQKLIEYADNIKQTLQGIKGEKRLLTTRDLVERYRPILEATDKGVIERDLGYKVLKDKAPHQAEPGEMTLLFGPSGMGKTAFGQNIGYSLIGRQVPVLKFGTEMTVWSEMSRSIAMRLNVSPTEFYKKNRGEIFNSKVERNLQAFTRIKNYLHVDESNLSLGDIRYLVRKAKEHFRREGVFRNGDEYVFVITDLASMIKGIAGEYGAGVEKGADELQIISKEEYIHNLLLVQANENKFRSGVRFKKAEEIDRYVLADEDIMGGAAWLQRCRAVFCILRPLMLKKKYFPDRMEEWLLEEDLIWLSCIKYNDGPLFRIPFIFDTVSFRISPYLKKKEESFQNK